MRRLERFDLLPGHQIDGPLQNRDFGRADGAYFCSLSALLPFLPGRYLLRQ